MSHKGKDGISLRDTLLTVKGMTGKTPLELVSSEIPSIAAEVWGWFLALNNTRASGFGASAITYTEMQAYFNFIGVTPNEWEFSLLQLFDRIALESFNEETK